MLRRVGASHRFPARVFAIIGRNKKDAITIWWIRSIQIVFSTERHLSLVIVGVVHTMKLKPK